MGLDEVFVLAEDHTLVLIGFFPDAVI